MSLRRKLPLGELTVVTNGNLVLREKECGILCCAVCLRWEHLKLAVYFTGVDQYAGYIS